MCVFVLPSDAALLRQAVALLDAHAGDGGAFWQDYTHELLPRPAHLALPFCLPPQLLEELQDTDIISGAQQQQVRHPCLGLYFCSAEHWTKLWFCAWNEATANVLEVHFVDQSTYEHALAINWERSPGKL